MDFMSIEVESQRYLFLRLPVTADIPFFYHNSLHELESVWWLATWVLLFHYPRTKAASGNLESQRTTLRNVFPRVVGSAQRHQFLTSGYQQFGTGTTKILHADVQSYGEELQILCRKLLASYVAFEACLAEPDPQRFIDNFPKEMLGGIHAAFELTFKAMADKLANDDVKLTPLHEVEEETKRTIAEVKPGPSGHGESKRPRCVYFGPLFFSHFQCIPKQVLERKKGLQRITSTTSSGSRALEKRKNSFVAVRFASITGQK